MLAIHPGYKRVIAAIRISLEPEFAGCVLCKNRGELVLDGNECKYRYCKKTSRQQKQQQRNRHANILSQLARLSSFANQFTPLLNIGYLFPTSYRKVFGFVSSIIKQFLFTEYSPAPAFTWKSPSSLGTIVTRALYFFCDLLIMSTWPSSCFCIGESNIILKYNFTRVWILCRFFIVD